jgi:hypothetical protein
MDPSFESTGIGWKILGGNEVFKTEVMGYLFKTFIPLKGMFGIAFNDVPVMGFFWRLLTGLFPRPGAGGPCFIDPGSRIRVPLCACLSR